MVSKGKAICSFSPHNHVFHHMQPPPQSSEVKKVLYHILLLNKRKYSPRQTISIFFINHLCLQMPVSSTEHVRDIVLFPRQGPGQHLACAAHRGVNLSVITPRIARTVCWWGFAYSEEETVIKHGNWCLHKQHVGPKQLRSLKTFQKRMHASPHLRRLVRFPLCTVLLSSLWHHD